MLFEIRYFFYKYKAPLIFSIGLVIVCEFLLQALFSSLGYQAFDQGRYTVGILLMEYLPLVGWFCINFSLYRFAFLPEISSEFPILSKRILFLLYFANTCIFLAVPIMNTLISGHINAFERVGIYLVKARGGGYSASDYVSGYANFVMFFVGLIVFYRVVLLAEKEYPLYASEPILQEKYLVRQFIKLDVAFFILLVLMIVFSNVAYDQYLKLFFSKVYPDQLAVAHRYSLYCGASFFFSTVPNLVLSYLMSRVWLVDECKVSQ